MKKILILLVVMLNLIGCKQEEILMSQTQKRDGIIYKIGKDKPYSGIVLDNYRKSSYSQKEAQVKNKLSYKKGRLDGDQLVYYKNGNLKSKINFKNGELDGKLLSYYIDEKSKDNLNYKLGYLEGKQTSYYETGELFYAGEINSGKGEVSFYTDEGALWYKENFINVKEIAINKKTLKDGLKKKGKILYNAAGDAPFNGIYIDYHDRVEKYKDGIMFKSKAYYPNGTLRYVTRYDKKGNKEGKQVIYFENGKISNELNFKNDRFHGVQKRFYKNGSLMLVEEYGGDYGKKIGTSKIYNDKNELIKEVEQQVMSRGTWGYRAAITTNVNKLIIF